MPPFASCVQAGQAVMKVLPSMTSSHILAKFGAPPDPTKPLEIFRSDFSQKASLWEWKRWRGSTPMARPASRTIAQISWAMASWQMV